MKKYNFAQGTEELEQTVRLDNINEEMQRMEKLEKEFIARGLGDKDDFLDAFESEIFDSIEDTVQEEDLRTEHINRKSIYPRDLTKTQDSRELQKKTRKSEQFLTKKYVTIMAVIGVIVAIGAFYVARVGIDEKEPIVLNPMLIQGVLGEGQFVVYDILNQADRSIVITEETLLAPEEGQSTTIDKFVMGDIVLVGMNKKQELQSFYHHDKTKTIQTTGLTIDTQALTLKGKEESPSYTYHEKTLFLYEGEKVKPDILKDCDVIEITSIDGMVWCIEILEYHGYITIDNEQNIENGMIRINEEQEIPLSQVGEICLKEGEHVVSVWGDNVEKRTDTILIEAGKVYTHDLSKVQEKVGVIAIKTNVEEYKLYINGALMESNEPAVLPLGNYDIVILKNGYIQWSQNVTLAEDTLTVEANLEKDIQYGTLVITSDADPADVYIDGIKVEGQSPLDLNLTYGGYELKIEKEGYDPSISMVVVNQDSTYINVELEKED